jgi:signal transduction histidine kinase
VRLSSLSAKVLLAFLVVLATFGGVAAYGAWVVLRLGDDVQRVASAYLPLRLDLHDLQTGQLNLVKLLERTDEETDRGPGFVKSDVDLARRSRKHNVVLIEARVDALVVDARTGEERSFLRSLADRLRDIEGTFAEDEELFDHLFGPPGARPIAVGPVDKRLQQTARERLLKREDQLLRKDLGDLMKQLRGRVELAEAGIAREERRAVWASVLLGVLASIVSIVVMLVVQRAMRPLARLAESAKELGRGNYRQRVDASGADEVAQLAAEFNAMASALEEREVRLIRSERLAAVGKIAAQITHEVRNPLSSIGLNAELLEEELAGSPDARKLAQAIVREVDRLAGITEQYLRFARLPRPDLAPEELNDLVGSLLSFLRGELEARGVTVEAELARDLPPALVDENQIRQALLNILRNGAEAMVDGGRLKVSTAADPDGRTVTVRISDTGPGIAAEHQPKIFDPFFTTKEKGTGLGLALTQQIVVEHGGRIEVISAPGEGTTFVVYLKSAVDRPRAPPAPADQHASAVAATATATG